MRVKLLAALEGQVLKDISIAAMARAPVDIELHRSKPNSRRSGRESKYQE